MLLLTCEVPAALSLMTPKGIPVEVEPVFCRMEGEGAVCAVQKDAGDDPDVTDGIVILANVRKLAHGISIDGGEGIGWVTKPGLDQSVGAAAINSVPREMITAAVQAVCDKAGYTGGLEVVISAPEGTKIAKKTFNPMLGIEGGISILGTSGIVEPMSEKAIVDTIEIEIRQAFQSGARTLIAVPGNYGMDFLQRELRLPQPFPTVKCSNYLGDTIDLALLQGFSSMLIVGHIGKLVKLAGGIMNTHSKMADCRRELFCAHASLCGADRSLCSALMEQPTTEGCLTLLEKANLREAVMQSLLQAMQTHLDRRTGGEMRIGAVVFSMEAGLLGMTDAAKQLLEEWNSIRRKNRLPISLLLAMGWNLPKSSPDKQAVPFLTGVKRAFPSTNGQNRLFPPVVPSSLSERQASACVPLHLF